MTKDTQELLYLQHALFCFQNKKYHHALFYLKKILFSNPYHPVAPLLSFLCWKRLKNKKKALKILWKYHHFQPHNIKIAQLFVYYFLVWKKEGNHCLLIFKNLDISKKPDGFSLFLLSRYYYFRKQDLRKALFFARSSLQFTKRKFLFYWYCFLLARYSLWDNLKKWEKYFFVRRLTGNFKISDRNNLEFFWEKLFFLKKKGVILLDRETFFHPVYQYWLLQKYGISYASSFWNKDLNIAKIKNKKQNKQPFFTDNKIKYIIIFLIFVLLLYLLKGDG